MFQITTQRLRRPMPINSSFVTSIRKATRCAGFPGRVDAFLPRLPPIGARWLLVRLLALLVLLGGASSAQAGTDFCSGYPVINGFHVIDGSDPALNAQTLPSSIGIDANCNFRNFPISAKWPQGLTATLNFKSDGFLAIFDNVNFSGNMACATTTTKIWFVNNARYAPNNS